MQKKRIIVGIGTVMLFILVTVCAYPKAKIIYHDYKMSKIRNATVAELFANYEGDEEVWKVIQYEDASGSQGLFYAIASNTGRLILVDAGDIGNAGQLNDVIAAWGCHVDAWIVTHPHADHICAFNEVYPYEWVETDAVYDSPIDYEYYDTVDNSWDGIEYYSYYLNLMQNNEKLHHIGTGDSITIDNLQIEFYNSYDEYDESYGDVGNNAGLVFRVGTTDGEKKMLFCADCYAPAVYDRILSQFGTDALQADYIQLPHHGNTVFPDAYVTDYVKPSVCFFDAPVWLFDPESKYNAKDHWAAMTEYGATCYRFDTAPNVVELY